MQNSKTDRDKAREIIIKILDYAHDEILDRCETLEQASQEIVNESDLVERVKI